MDGSPRGDSAPQNTPYLAGSGGLENRLRRGRPDLHIVGSRRRRAVRSCGPRRNQRPPREIHDRTSRHTSYPPHKRTLAPRRGCPCVGRSAQCRHDLRRTRSRRSRRCRDHRRRRPRHAAPRKLYSVAKQTGRTRHPAHTRPSLRRGRHTSRRRPRPRRRGTHRMNPPGRPGLTLTAALSLASAAVDAVTVRQAASAARLLRPKRHAADRQIHKPLLRRGALDRGDRSDAL